MAQQYGLGNAFGDILNSYVGMKQTQQRNALAQQELDLSREKFSADQQYRNSLLNQQDRQANEEQYQADLAKEQWEQTFAEEQKVRDAQIGASDASRDESNAAVKAAREDARQKLLVGGSKELLNMTGGSTIGEAIRDGRITEDVLDGWLRQYGGAFRVFDYKGQTREYAGIEPLVDADGNATGEYTVLLRNPATGTTGPMTNEGGTDGQEEVIRFDAESLPALYQSIDNQFAAALDTGGRELSNQLAGVFGANAYAGDGNMTVSTLRDRYNSRDAVVANSVNARAGGTRGASNALATPGDAGIRASDPLAAAESDRRDAALGLVDNALNRPTVNRQLSGQELYALGLAQNQGVLTSDQFANAAVGDTPRGDVKDRAAERINTGTQMAQDATANIANIQDKQATRSAAAAAIAADAKTDAIDRRDEIIDRIPDVAATVLAGQGISADNPMSGQYASQFKTAMTASYNANNTALWNTINDPAKLTELADTWFTLQRTINRVDDGNKSAPSDNILFRTWNNLIPVKVVQDAANTDIGKQKSIDMALLAMQSGMSGRDFIVDVMQPIANIRGGRKITATEFQKAMSDLEAYKEGVAATGQQLDVPGFLRSKLGTNG